jgi:hypothetical protein
LRLDLVPHGPRHAVDTSRCKSGTLNEIALTILENDGGPSEDILFAPVTIDAHQATPYKVFEGRSSTHDPHPSLAHGEANRMATTGVTVRPEKEGTSRVKVSYIRWDSNDKLGVPLGRGSTVYHFPTVIRTSLDVQSPKCPMKPSDVADCGSEGITADVCTKAGCCYYPSQVLLGPDSEQTSVGNLEATEEWVVGPLHSIDRRVAQQNHSGCHFNSDVIAQALYDFQFVLKNRETLLETHTAAWLELWDSRIEIQGTHGTFCRQFVSVAQNASRSAL